MLTYSDIKYYHSMVNKAKEILDRNNVPYSQDIEFDTFNRVRSWGQCEHHNYDDSYTIKLTESLIASHSEKAILDTLIHELLHTCPNCMCHTGDWLAWANLINRREGFNIKRITTAEEKGLERTYKYKVVCDKCNSNSYYNKDTKFIKVKGKNYRCKCGSHAWHTYRFDGSLAFAASY